MPLRATITVIATVVSLFLLFSFKTPNLQPAVALTPHQPTPTPAPTTPPSTSSSAASVTATATTPAPTPGLHDGTFVGQTESMYYGPVQVSLTVSGGKITAVKNLQLPYDHPQSAYISQYVGPMLQQEVLQAQSAQINGISGATYTSEAYYQSVQSALSQAGG